MYVYTTTDFAGLVKLYILAFLLEIIENMKINNFLIGIRLFKICFLMVGLACACPIYAQDFFQQVREGWLKEAAQTTPVLIKSIKKPLKLVTIVKDKAAFQGYKAVPMSDAKKLYDTAFQAMSGVVVDFGEHLTGHLSFCLRALKQTPDAPLRLKFTFGEVPSEVVTPFDPYTGGLSRAWLQDEVVTVMEVPDTIVIPRRVAFRYVKIELLAKPGFPFAISKLSFEAVSSASATPSPLLATTPALFKKIDSVGLATLKECMQTVFEDGPKRDQRLWIGDLYLQSMANNYSYKQYNLSKHCLYLLAGLSSDNGILHAAVFDRPVPHPQAGQFLLEYALLYGAALKEYLIATGDQHTAKELWPVVKKQLDIVNRYVGNDGLMDFENAAKEWWIFFDWKDGLYKEVPLQGISIFALNEAYDLSRLIGKEHELAYVPPLVKKMRAAARKWLYNQHTDLFVGLHNKQVSYASQIWMILAGVPSQKQAQRALAALETIDSAVTPVTPYLNHYYVQALINSGMQDKAREVIGSYWGGMVSKGADTFWEAYDPKDDYLSPYGFFPVNSYCHAWSCTPLFFIRKYPEIFQLQRTSK
ncbi:alpha-L-rhamnosidase [bacterium A37T11]|nr:alpha-L-rhamnosidase [bacterium A37T11]